MLESGGAGDSAFEDEYLYPIQTRLDVNCIFADGCYVRHKALPIFIARIYKLAFSILNDGPTINPGLLRYIYRLKLEYLRVPFYQTKP